MKLEGQGNTPKARPMGIKVAADGSIVYITTGRFGHLFFADPAKTTAANSIEVGQRPWGIALMADGKTAYTANGPSNDVSVVDLVAKSVTKKIPAGRGPWGVAVISR
jgi:YVTN family beta-propeller protein